MEMEGIRDRVESERWEWRKMSAAVPCLNFVNHVLPFHHDLPTGFFGVFVELLVRIETNGTLYHLEERNIGLGIPHPHGPRERESSFAERAFQDLVFRENKVREQKSPCEFSFLINVVHQAVHLIESKCFTEPLEGELWGVRNRHHVIPFALKVPHKVPCVAIRPAFVLNNHPVRDTPQITIRNTLDVAVESHDDALDIRLIPAVPIQPIFMGLFVDIRDARLKNHLTDERVNKLDQQTRAEYSAVNIENGDFLFYHRSILACHACSGLP